jgi:hypothetical protein
MTITIYILNRVMFRFETKLIFLLVMEQQEAHSQILQSV